MKKIVKTLLTFIQVRWIKKFHSRKELEKYQNKEIKKHLNYLKNKSPYFRKNNIKGDFITDKKFVMENFDELNTLGIKKKRQ